MGDKAFKTRLVHSAALTIKITFTTLLLYVLSGLTSVTKCPLVVSRNFLQMQLD